MLSGPLRRGAIRVCEKESSCHPLLAARLMTLMRRSHFLSSSALKILKQIIAFFETSMIPLSLMSPL